MKTPTWILLLGVMFSTRGFGREMARIAFGRPYTSTRVRTLVAPLSTVDNIPRGGANKDTVIDHVVLLKVKPGTSRQQLRDMEQGVQSLTAIPGVLNITIGPTFVERWMEDRRKGVTHTLCVRLESKKALKLYQDHELHVQIKKDFIVPIVSEVPMAVDYESTVSTPN